MDFDSQSRSYDIACEFTIADILISISNIKIFNSKSAVFNSVHLPYTLA